RFGTAQCERGSGGTEHQLNNANSRTFRSQRLGRSHHPKEATMISSNSRPSFLQRPNFIATLALALSLAASSLASARNDERNRRWLRRSCLRGRPPRWFEAEPRSIGVSERKDFALREALLVQCSIDATEMTTCAGVSSATKKEGI